MTEKTGLTIPEGYTQWLLELKTRIATTRQRAVLSVNQAQIHLYLHIGQEILQRQTQQGWGAKVIDRLAKDLQDSFPETKGFSSSNLKYMRVFAENCPNGLIGQQPADQLPWFHIVLIMTKLASQDLREWYALQTVAQGWSRTVLSQQIKNQLHLRQAQAVTNFAVHLPEAQSKLAHEALKDPYLFDFLGLDEAAHERDIENALIRHITRFLLELGAGFAFIGKQHRIEVNGDEFFIDLLFYHTKLKCYVVVELKAAAFKPEHAGQLNFYLSAVDAQIKAEDDKPTIGLLLCKDKNRLVAEYALSGINKPIGIANYELVRALPTPLDVSLPSISDIEAELQSELNITREEE
jgi:predicted nuclease of restriction endonuclease-like (RecB) superfamily